MERVGVGSLFLAVLLVLHAAGGQQTELASKFYNSLVSHVKPCNDKLCVADRSKIYILNTDLTPHQNISTCKNEEDQCSNVLKVFLMNEAHTKLVTCGLENGGCQVRSFISDSSTLTDVGTKRKNIVSNNANRPAKASFTPSGQLLIAVTYGSDLESTGNSTQLEYSYAFSTWPLSGSTFSGPEKNLTLVLNKTEKIESPEDYLIYFKGVFSYTYFTYFTTNQKDFVGSNNYVSKLVRFCNSDTESTQPSDTVYLSYVDFEITCKQDGKKYNLIQDSVIVKYFGTDYFIGAFTAGDDPEKPTGDSLVCVTTLEQTKSSVYTAWKQFRNCSDNRTFTSDDKRYFPKSWTNCTIDESDFSCASKDFIYVLGITPLNLTPVYKLPGDPYGHVTKIFGRTLEPGMVDLHIGTSKGRVLKFNFYVDGRDLELEMYSEMTVHNGFSIIDFVDDTTTDTRFMFVASEKKIVKYAETSCSEFTSCEETIKGKNPLCGWCIYEGKSTWKTKCEDQNFWLSSLDDCLTLTLNPEGQNVEESNKQVELTLPGLNVPNPQNSSEYEYECRYKNESGFALTKSVTANGNLNSNLSCTATLDDAAHGYVTLELWSKKQEQPESASVYLASAKFLYFQCSNFESCGQCTGTIGDSCVWCFETNECQSNNDISADKIDGKYSCPHLQSVEPEFIPSGEKITLTFTAPKLKPKDNQYFCLINGTDFSATVTEPFTLTCNVNVSYKTNQTSDEYSVSILYTKGQNNKKVKLDDENNLKVRVYRCDVLGKDCSHCKAVNSSRYSCQWKDGSCKYCDGSCSSQECPAPTIDKVTPNDGWFRGGTTITITGTNLGESISRIQEVKVGGKNCSLSTNDAEYDPLNDEEYIHHVPNQGVQNPGMASNVSLTVSSKTSVGTNKFTYKEPNITGIYPNEGPIAGGTLVDLTGRNLAIGNRDVGVWINSNPFKDCSYINGTTTPDVIQCYTPYSNGNLTSISFYMNGYAGYQQKFQATDILKFTRLDDPIVGRVSSSKGTLSGGTEVTVNGELLDNAQKITMVASYAGIKTVSKCLNVSSTRVVCKVPAAPPQAAADLKDIIGAQPSKRSKRATDCNGCVEVDVVIHLDGVTYNFQLQFFPDPHFNKFEGDAITVFKSDTQRLILTGSNLNLVVVKDQIGVTIGVEKCIVDKLTENQLECLAPKDQPKPGIPGAQYPEVNVTVGNLKMQLGFLRYELDETIKQIAVIAGAVGGALVVVAVIGVVLGVLMYRRAGKRASALKNKLNAMEIKKISREDWYVITDFQSSETISLS